MSIGRGLKGRKNRNEKTITAGYGVGVVSKWMCCSETLFYKAIP
jgi:hypothetical protein